MKEIKEIKEEIIINIKTDIPGSIYITKRLLEKVIKKEIEFDVRFREGSLEVQFILGFISGYFSSLLGNISWDIVKTIWRKLRREINLGREPSPATLEVKSLSLEERITGYETIEELKEKFYQLDLHNHR